MINMSRSAEKFNNVEDRRLVNSSPIISRHESISGRDPNKSDSDSDSDSDSNGSGVIDHIEKKMKARNERLYRPMSSPIRGERSCKGGFQSRALGAKYTLRGRHYIPFNQQRRHERRAKIALDKRGGNEEMERFIQHQETQEGIDILNHEASSHMFSIEELSEDGPLEFRREVSPPKIDAYERELEEMIRMEQEELEMLTANLNLDS